MPKFLCACGYAINLSEVPSDGEFSLVPEASIYEAGALADSGETTTEALFDVLDSKARTVYDCPQCGRLHVETAPRSHQFASFVKEAEEE